MTKGYDTYKVQKDHDIYKVHYCTQEDLSTPVKSIIDGAT